jgi:peptidoglycan/LPS O-acetylase OafA/YrhL
MRMPSRILVLDILRGCAVLLVIGRHQIPFPEGSHPLLKPFMDAWLRGGWVGVDLFFVLSGFFVSGLLFREQQRYGTLNFPRFFVRRGFKIYPSFYLLILVTVIVAHALGQVVPRRRLWTELLYIQSYRFGLWDHTWSLAVEEHFYLLLPLLLILLMRGRPGASNPFTALPWIVGLLAAGCLALRIENAFRHPYSHIGSLFPTHLRLDSLAFGVLVSYAFHYHADRFWKLARAYQKPLALGGCVLLAPAFIFQLETHAAIYTVGLTSFYLGSGLLLTSALTWHIPHHRFPKMVAFVGSQSYSIYLWHLPTRAWVSPLLEQAFPQPPGPAISFLLYFTACLVLGCAMGLLVETPFLRLRDRLFPSRSAPLVATT